MGEQSIAKKTGRSRSIKSFVKIWFVPLLAVGLIKIIFHAVRWVRNDLESFSTGEPVIGAFWHGRQLMLAPLFSGKNSFPLLMLISSHADGQLISRAIKWFGISTVYGSSSRNGAEALLQMLQALAQGVSVGITPDGPRGPLQKVKPGIIKLASLSQKKIVPVSFSTSAYWRFKSWDTMILPKPFSKGVCLIGSPITIPPNIEGDVFDSWMETVEKEMNALQNACDNFFT